MEMERLGFALVLTWDASIEGSNLTHCAIMMYLQNALLRIKDDKEWKGKMSYHWNLKRISTKQRVTWVLGSWRSSYRKQGKQVLYSSPCFIYSMCFKTCEKWPLGRWLLSSSLCHHLGLVHHILSAGLRCDYCTSNPASRSQQSETPVCHPYMPWFKVVNQEDEQPLSLSLALTLWLSSKWKQWNKYLKRNGSTN